MSRFLCVVALAAAGMFTFAATVRADDPANTANNPTTNNAANTATENTGANHHNANMMRPWRASETIGVRVENPQGDSLGKIEDLVFEPAKGHIRYAVLSFGGFLGVGDKYFAIPWSHLRAEERAGRSGSERFVMVLDVNKDKLKNAPGFDSKNWPDFGDPAYGTSVDQYYGRAHHARTDSAHLPTETETK
jgi:sporulation protein YlmC with PRC-barrel domain